MRINLFGGPGIGKSRRAAAIYNEGGCELVQEFVKPMAFQGKVVEGWDCVKTFACQLSRELEILDYTDIVTDSPLLLQVIYAKLNGCVCWKSLLQIAMDFEEDYSSVNYIMERQFDYNSDGRLHNKLEARKLDITIKEHLETWGVKIETLPRVN